MRIGIHGGSDQGTVDNCKRIGIEEVCLTLPFGDRGYVELDALKKAKNFLARFSHNCPFVDVVLDIHN